MTEMMMTVPYNNIIIRPHNFCGHIKISGRKYKPSKYQYKTLVYPKVRHVTTPKIMYARH